MTDRRTRDERRLVIERKMQKNEQKAKILKGVRETVLKRISCCFFYFF